MILMQQSLISGNILFDVGNASFISKMKDISALPPFADQITEFLNQVSKILLNDSEARKYPDIVTFAFWIRRASVEGLKKHFADSNADGIYRVGRGTLFHIAPSNVPVNYAYSLVSGLLCGNANIVRIPSKDFPQVRMINHAINNALKEHVHLSPYIVLAKYGHDKVINDLFSSIADVRIVWGGDRTIDELRKSPLKPRASEITFADRFSLAVIDSDEYMKISDKKRTANDFYNDTYLTDQNACTSPRVIVWTGSKIQDAKKMFWSGLHNLVVQKYKIQGVQAVNKLTSGYLLAASMDGVNKENMPDNLIVRMNVKELSQDIMDLKDNSGYFFEYECKDIMEIKELCNQTACQTVSYIGEKEMLLPLVASGIKGIDRIVPVGKTMDFDFIWDGYNLFERMTRVVAIQ